MKSGSGSTGWRFVDGAPGPVNIPARASGNGSLPVQQPRQPVLELSDTQGIEAAARAFVVENPPCPISFAAGSTQGDPILSLGGGNFSAAGAACSSTDACLKPRAHAAAAAGESVVGPTTEDASTDSRQFTFFHVFYSDS